MDDSQQDKGWLQDRIAAVESNVRPTVVVAGRTGGGARLEDRMAAYGVPGLSIAVIDNFEVGWAKGYGVADADDGRPVHPRTRFQAASISKPVSALAAMHLVERGVLGLDRDVNEQLRLWRVPDSDLTASQPVTLRHLLCHAAGISVSSVPGYEPGAALPTLTQILDGLPPATNDAVRVEDPPGKAFRYSGGGYTVVQQLMMDATGETFEACMRRTILDELGMSDSTFETTLPDAWIASVASGHDGSGRPVSGHWRVHPESAAAGLWTTATDLARFAIELQLARAGRSETLITQPTAVAMLTPQIDDTRGLGPWLAKDPPRFFHSGGNNGFRCKLVGDVMTGRGAVVMTNGDGGLALIDETLNAVARAHGWPAFTPEREAVALESPVLDRYVGTYALGSFVVEIHREGDHLVGSAPSIGESELFAESERVFFPLELPVKLVFDGAGDESTAVTVQGDRFDLVALRTR